MADNVTDSSNQKQFVLCLRWVDVDLNPHEEFIGLHVVPNICANTLVACIRDVLIRMNLTHTKIAETSVLMALAACLEQNLGWQLKSNLKSRELFLVIAMGILCNCLLVIWLRKSKNLKDDLDTTSEISKLLKVSKKKKKKKKNVKHY